MDNAQLKQRIFAAIDQSREEILSIANEIMQHPELGYKEFQTSALAKNVFDKYNIPYTAGHAVTGVKGKLRGKESRLNVCMIGEMDAVRCFAHPDADSTTGAAHACGHNVQMSLMLGTAIAFAKSGVYSELFGDVTFFAVPAEEFVELEFRSQLKKDGKISYFGGKQQLIYEGAFDDVDIAMMMHAMFDCPNPHFYMDGTNLGFVGKIIDFYGKEAHGSLPHEGINALNAAMLALMGIHTNRETFRDEDKIKVHPILTNGGEMVNTVPGHTTMETFVRGANLPAIQSAAETVDRAILGAAYTVGAKAKITNTAGYLPMKQSVSLGQVFAQNAAEVTPKAVVSYDTDMFGSSDIGDLSHILPLIQPMTGGFSGTAHGKDFGMTDPDFACIGVTKVICATIIDLLADNAALGAKIKADFTPLLSKDEYVNYLRSAEKEIISREQI